MVRLGHKSLRWWDEEGITAVACTGPICLSIEKPRSQLKSGLPGWFQEPGMRSRFRALSLPHFPTSACLEDGLRS